MRMLMWPKTANQLRYYWGSFTVFLWDCAVRQQSFRPNWSSTVYFTVQLVSECIKIDQILQECKMDLLTPFCLQLQAALSCTPAGTGSNVILSHFEWDTFFFLFCYHCCCFSGLDLFSLLCMMSTQVLSVCSISFRLVSSSYVVWQFQTLFFKGTVCIYFFFSLC